MDRLRSAIPAEIRTRENKLQADRGTDDSQATLHPILRLAETIGRRSSPRAECA
ncbi:hypothetical protein X737_22195 [Mesorhizobium sp. L48C026A00]|nr:hypothetical protein X737_22195 [Mesorhizobium sp. L48C026A00]